MNMKKAFTLAEVLITLGIIGIVAAMTLPAITAKHKKMETSARLKKFYTTFTNAMLMAQKDYGDTSTWDYSVQSTGTPDSFEANQVFFNKYLFPYLHGIKICEPNEQACKNIANKCDVNSNEGKSFSRYIFEDGTCFGILTGGSSSSGAAYHIWFDTNCSAKPNVCGKDQFMFTMKLAVNKSSRLPFQAGSSLTDIRTRTRAQLLQDCKSTPQTCAALIQYDGWQIDDDYPIIY